VRGSSGSYCPTSRGAERGERPQTDCLAARPPDFFVSYSWLALRLAETFGVPVEALFEINWERAG